MYTNVRSYYTTQRVNEWLCDLYNSTSPMDSPYNGLWRGALIFLSAPEQTVEQSNGTPVIRDAIALITTSV